MAAPRAAAAGRAAAAAAPSAASSTAASAAAPAAGGAAAPAAPDAEPDLKIILLGDSAVGKSKLVERFLMNDYVPRQMSTYALTVFRHKQTTEDGKEIEIDFWDTAGQERFNSMHPSYYYRAHACILVFDVTRKVTYQHLQEWSATSLGIQQTLLHDCAILSSVFFFCFVGFYSCVCCHAGTTNCSSIDLDCPRWSSQTRSMVRDLSKETDRIRAPES
jgi:hypothetical protein